MAAISLAVENSNVPAWLPTPRDIVSICREHGYSHSSFSIHGPDGSDAAFIKYGHGLNMGEARTQDYIANIVNSDKEIVVLVPRIYYAFRHKGISYIVMQHVGDCDCNQDDLPAIALAVKRLMAIPSPTASPGPVGGGPIMHRFFSDHQSSIQYDSVGDLQWHINSILARAGYECRVDFNEEDGGNLRLCLDDIHEGNFRKDKDGRLFAIDFAKNNFLPYAFQDFAFGYGHSLASKVGASLGFSPSKYLWDLRLASGRLQLFNNSEHGLLQPLRQLIGSRDLCE